MLYRIAQAVNASYGLAIAWGYIAAFVLSLSLLFIFPQLTLLMFFLGLASLGVSIGLGWLIDGFTRTLARKAVSKGRCPRCADISAISHTNDEMWICDHCGSEFKIDGSETSERERARFVEHVPQGNLTPIFDNDPHAEAWRGT